MTYVIVLLVACGFIAFFSLVNLRYFGLLPLFFLIFFFSQGFYNFKVNLPDHLITQKYGLYLLALLALFGGFGLLTFLGATNHAAFWTLLILSGLARASSYIFDYQDGKSLFKHGVLLLAGLIIIEHLIRIGIPGVLNTIGILCITVLIGFTGVYHGLGRYFTVDKSEYYSQLFLCLLLSVWCVFALQERPMYGFTFGLINVAGALGLLTYAFNYQLPSKPAKRELSLRRVLAGERILQKEKPDPRKGRKTFILDLKSSPLFLHRGIEYLNLFLLLGIVISYLLPLFGGVAFHQLRYWTGIALFTLNAFLLKKTQAFSIATRFASSFVLNFSLYISLLLLGGDSQAALPWLIGWNMLCGILILYANTDPLPKYLYKSDLIFWMISSLMAMILNIYLITQLPYSGQLAFSLIALYLGVQGTISYYAFHMIKTYQSSSQNTQELIDLINTPIL